MYVCMCVYIYIYICMYIYIYISYQSAAAGCRRRDADATWRSKARQFRFGESSNVSERPNGVGVKGVGQFLCFWVVWQAL